jgi:hypothetical protein
MSQRRAPGGLANGCISAFGASRAVEAHDVTEQPAAANVAQAFQPVNPAQTTGWKACATFPALRMPPRGAHHGMRPLRVAATLCAMKPAPEITFTVERDEESSLLVASWDDPSGQGGITTQGGDLRELQDMVKDAATGYFRAAGGRCRAGCDCISSPTPSLHWREIARGCSRNGCRERAAAAGLHNRSSNGIPSHNAW